MGVDKKERKEQKKYLKKLNHVPWSKDWKRNRIIYLIFLPVLAYEIIFHYLPMFGVAMAFQDYSMVLGPFKSRFCGFDNFVELFSGAEFPNALKNTIMFMIFQIGLGFFPSIIFALLLSEVRHKRFRRIVQMITYLPNFVSAMVVTELLKMFLGMNGPLTSLLCTMGFERQNWLANATPPVFWIIYTMMGVWQGFGMGTIVYMAAIANINGDLKEAAVVDGANRWQRMMRITVPNIMPMVTMLFILNLAVSFRTAGMNVLLLYMPSTYSVADCLYTYTYRMAFGQGADIGLSTASGLFQSVVGTILLIAGNSLSGKLTKNKVF